jgi:3-oxoacyl-[acyl-carrier-protein] synthase III
MRKVKIAGIGSRLPGEPIPNEALERIFGTADEWLTSQLGIKSRYWATDIETGRCRESNSDMAAKAGLEAVRSAGLTVDQIDCIILSTGTPDYPLPATVPFVQEKMGVGECAVLELRSGCIGAIQALSIGAHYVRAGTYDHVLILGSECVSPFLTQGFLAGGGDPLTTADRLNALMYGDGAGALLLAESNDEEGILAESFKSVGVGKEPAFTLPAGGSVIPLNHEAINQGLHRFKHDYKAIYKWGPELVMRGLDDVMTKANLQIEDVHHYILPQTNASTLQRHIRRVVRLKPDHVEEFVPAGTADNLSRGIERLKRDPQFVWEKEVWERVFINADRVGNTGSAAFFVALDELFKSGELEPGQIVVLGGGEATKWLCGGAAIRWSL